MMNNKTASGIAPYPVSRDLSEVPSLLKEYGVCVIPNVFSDNECDSWMQEILSNMEAISGNTVDYRNPEGWTGDKLPPQVRYGLYQHSVNNLKPVWEIRRDQRWMNIFEAVYSELRGTTTDKFVCSIDGINIQPNISRNVAGAKDWPHCDQTKRDDVFKCVQGQVVLTNTSASFRASPTSHKYFKEIMSVAGIPDTDSNFAKFSDSQLRKIKDSVIIPNQVPFQVPIEANKGSVILWFSTTIHSAMSSGVKQMPSEEDPFKGWRGVVYVCYRPKSEFSQSELDVLEDCLENNRGTNHWSTRVSPLICKGPYSSEQVISPRIQKLVSQPNLIYDIIKFKPNNKSCLINDHQNGLHPVFHSSAGFHSGSNGQTQNDNKSGELENLSK